MTRFDQSELRMTDEPGPGAWKPENDGYWHGRTWILAWTDPDMYNPAMAPPYYHPWVHPCITHAWSTRAVQEHIRKSNLVVGLNKGPSS